MKNRLIFLSSYFFYWLKVRTMDLLGLNRLIITSQIKKTDWHLLLDGPGKGIAMEDGTLIFPAQYKNEGKSPTLLLFTVKTTVKDFFLAHFF